MKSSFISIILLSGNELYYAQATKTEKWFSLSDIEEATDSPVFHVQPHNVLYDFGVDLSENFGAFQWDNILNFELTDRGCGNGEYGSSNFAITINDGVVNDETIDAIQKWHKVRYTIEFVSGASSCWSMFGDTHYGNFQLWDEYNGHEVSEFGLTAFEVTDNGLTVGDWNGEQRLCNNEKSNFMHRKNGLGNKGYLTVEQDRDTSVDVAGISAGFSCTSIGQKVRVKDIFIAYWIQDEESNISTSDLTPSPTIQITDFPTTEPTPAPIPQPTAFPTYDPTISPTQQTDAPTTFQAAPEIFEDALTLGLKAEDVFGEIIDIGEDTFNSKFANSKIIKRECPGCADSHKLIFYRRLSDIGDFNAYANMKSWLSKNNNMANGDFALYSTLDDLINDENRWTFCNYNDVGIGFPRDCGPTGHVAFQWTSATRGGKATKFSILHAELPDEEDIEWFKSYDYDNNDLISFDEVIQGLDMDSEDKEKHSSELSKLFADMDTNNDGGGSLREIWQNDLPDREFIDEFNAVDVDGDGLISFDDAIQSMDLDPQFIEEHRDAIITQLNEFFAEIDTDSDGVMSLSETFKYQEANQDDTSTTTTLAPIDDEDIE